MNVTAIRKNLGMSQSFFANTFNLPLGTLKDWEQKRTEPTGAAKTLLKVLAINPQSIIEALKPEKFKTDFDMTEYFTTSDPTIVEHRLKLAIASNEIEGFTETTQSTAFFESLPDDVSNDDFIAAFKTYKKI